MQVRSLGWDDPMAVQMATHSSILVWRTPWTEEPGGPWGCKESDKAEAESWILLSTRVRAHTQTHTHTHKSSCRRHGLSYFIIDFSSSTQLYFHFFIFSLPGTYHTSLTLILYIFSFRWVNGVIGLKMLRMYYVEMCNLQETKKCMYLRRLYR